MESDRTTQRTDPGEKPKEVAGGERLQKTGKMVSGGVLIQVRRRQISADCL